MIKYKSIVLLLSILIFVRLSADAQSNESEPDSIATTLLEELVVKGEEYSMVDGKLTIAPPEGVVKSSIFAIDLLGKLGIPGLTYDVMANSVSVNGSQPVILINGVISSMQRLRSIKASDVLSIQFTREVPLIFRKYGDSLIDVRIRSISEGGSLQIYAGSDVLFSVYSGNLMTTYNRGASQWELNYAIDGNNNHKTYDTSMVAYTSPQLKVEQTYKAMSPFRYLNNIPSLNYLYNPSNSLIFQAKFSLNTRDNLVTTTTSKAFDSIEGEYIYNGEGRTRNITPNLDLYFQKSFGSYGLLQASVAGSMGHINYSSTKEFHYRDNPNTLRSEIFNNNTKSIRQSLLTNISYGYSPLQSLNIELCYENVLSHTSNEYDTKSDGYTGRENNNYLYLQLVKGLGAFRIGGNTGVRCDYIKQGSLTDKYIHNSTKFWMNYNLSNKIWTRLMADYIPQPLPLNLLIPYEQQVNPYLVVTGNPALKKPQNWRVLWDMTLHFGHISITPQFIYSRTNRAFTTTYEFDADRSVYIQVPRNLAYFDSTTGTLEISSNEIGGMFNFSGSITLNCSKTMDRNQYAVSKKSVGAFLNVDWYYKKWSISFSYLIPCWQLAGYELTKNGKSSNLSVMWRPNNHWQLYGYYMYMFDSKGWAYQTASTTPYYSSSFSRSIKNFSNLIGFGVVYYCQFGDIFNWKGHKRTINSRDTQTTITKLEN